MNEIPVMSIVMVNYNTAAYSSQCIDSIYQNPPSVSYEIVLVDNASTDGSADLLEIKYPDVKLVRSPRNGGIAGGNNLGIRAGAGKFVLLLNNDTIVLPGTLDCSIEFLESHPDAGGVGGNLLNPDGSFQSGAYDFHNVFEEFLNITKIGHLIRPCYPSHLPYKECRLVDWICTAFMLFRRDALEEIGLVDEEFFIYADETDLQYRLKKKGWKIYYMPELNTIHFGGRSLSPWKSRKLKYRGRLLFCRRHGTVLDEVIIRTMYASASIIKLGIWGLFLILPPKRSRAKSEIISNIEVLQLAVTPHIPSPVV